jgi:N-methylhydantoinase B
VTLDPGTPDAQELPSMMPYRRVPAGAVLRMIAPSGGGYGDPFERDPERVRRDVRSGFHDAEAARTDYGVVLGPGPEFAIDVAATEACRATTTSQETTP